MLMHCAGAVLPRASGTLGKLCDPKPFQEASFRKNESSERSERSAQEPWGGSAIQNRYKKFASRNRKLNGASRSMSNQVYLGGCFCGVLRPKK